MLLSQDELEQMQKRFVYPRFSKAEYERRYSNIRKMMRELKLDCLLIVGGSAAYGRCWFNFRYVTNMMGNDESTVPAMLDSIAVAQNHVFLGVVSMVYWSHRGLHWC